MCPLPKNGKPHLLLPATLKWALLALLESPELRLILALSLHISSSFSFPHYVFLIFFSHLLASLIGYEDIIDPSERDMKL